MAHVKPAPVKHSLLARYTRHYVWRDVDDSQCSTSPGAMVRVVEYQHSFHNVDLIHSWLIRIIPIFT
jgi:hypothetical protein